MSSRFADFVEPLRQALRAGSPLVYCETCEDERARDVAFDLAERGYS